MSEANVTAEFRAEIGKALKEMSAREVTRLFGSSAGATGSGFAGLRSVLSDYMPFSFGDVIKPTDTNTDYPSDTRHMVVGSVNDGAVMTIDLDPERDHPDRRYLHLREKLTKRWQKAT